MDSMPDMGPVWPWFVFGFIGLVCTPYLAFKLILFIARGIVYIFGM